MKKSISLLLLIVTAFVLIGCDQFAFKTTTQDDSLTTEVDTLSTATSIALPSASLASLIGPFLDSSTSELVGYTVLEDTTEEDPVLDDVSELDKYLELVGQFLVEDNGLSITVSDSDKEAYSFMTSYSVTTLYDGVKTFVLYFNEVLPEEEPVTEEPVTTDTEETTTLAYGEEHEKFPCTDDDTEVVVAYIEALLIDGDNEVLLEGALVNNDTEQVLRLYAYTDNDNYVKLTVKTDSEDQMKKFFYRVVSEGITVSESKIFVETEDNELHVKLEILDGTVYTKFNANVESDDFVTRIKIKYTVSDNDVVLESGHIVITSTTDAETGESTYVYQVLPDGKTHTNQYTFHHGNTSKKDRDSKSS